MSKNEITLFVSSTHSSEPVVFVSCQIVCLASVPPGYASNLIATTGEQLRGLFGSASYNMEDDNQDVLERELHFVWCRYCPL